jgi:hypothetical protein
MKGPQGDTVALDLFLKNYWPEGSQEKQNVEKKLNQETGLTGEVTELLKFKQAEDFYRFTHKDMVNVTSRNNLQILANFTVPKNEDGTYEYGKLKPVDVGFDENHAANFFISRDEKGRIIFVTGDY